METLICILKIDAVGERRANGERQQVASLLFMCGGGVTVVPGRNLGGVTGRVAVVDVGQHHDLHLAALTISCTGKIRPTDIG